MKSNKYYNALHVFCFFLLISLTTSAQQKAKKKTGKNQNVYTYKIIEASNNTFGYDIHTNNKLSIHQPSIPAKPGSEGFATKKAAESVAKLVIDKIKKGQIPPTLSIEEMKK